MQHFSTFLAIICFSKISTGLYISSDREDRTFDKEWTMFKNKLGLTNQKVEFLKSQKDQEGTVSLINKFLEQNPKYNINNAENQSAEPNDFLRVYYNILLQLKNSKSTLKTSLNFELADKSQKSVTRRRRKIAVKMVSDLPSEKIDDLLKIFNLKHSIGDTNANDDDDSESEDESNYNDFPMNLPSASDPDYMYENLYEDEEDLAVPAKSHHNSEYGSLQDLILQASRNQLQREIEENKLRNHGSNHFI